MTCFKMLTESILATLIYVAPETYFTEQDICDYYMYLLENMPIYIPTNLSREAIENIVEEFDGIFELKRDGDSIAIAGGSATLCLDYFLKCNKELQQYILNITKIWLKERNAR